MMTWDALAGALNRESRTILRMRKRADAPKTPDFVAWSEYLAAKAASTAEAQRPKIRVTDDAALPGECPYDALVKSGKLTYDTAKERESVIGISIRNEAAKIENQKARGALVTKSEAERLAGMVRDALSLKFDRAVTRALATFNDLTHAQRVAIADAVTIELGDGDEG